MLVIPIRLQPMEVHIHADRRLVFQVITAFGVPAQAGETSTRVLSREDDKLLVEFHIPVRGLFGRQKVYRTVEWVTPYEPERVEFETVEGPTAMKRDRFILEEQEGCTCIRYESECGIWGWVPGWLLGVLYVRPMLKRLMQEHLEEMKRTIEARARRSKKFPQQPCKLEVTTSNDAT